MVSANITTPFFHPESNISALCPSLKETVFSHTAYDCAVFVCKYAEYIIRDKDPSKVDQSLIDNEKCRQKVALSILNDCLMT